MSIRIKVLLACLGFLAVTLALGFYGREQQRDMGALAVDIYDNAFTGVDNVVICTDNSTPSAVQCSPGSGYLVISGSGSDMISYSRVK